MKIWESFLPIVIPPDEPLLDAGWCAARGVEREAAVVLLSIREAVGDVERRLGGELEWFSFLVHNKDSGVPTTDDRAYIHLRLKFNNHPSKLCLLGEWWLYTREVELSDKIAGIDPKVLATEEAWLQLAWQSNWLLRFLQSMDASDPIEMVRHTRQFLHFFANMAQMRVG